MDQNSVEKGIVEKFLKQCLSNPVRRDEFKLSVKDGHTSFHYRIYTTITSTECTRIFFPRGTPVDSVEEKKHGQAGIRQISLSNLESFLEGLINAQLWNLQNCKEAGSPDEAELHFTLFQKDIPIFERKVWETCKYKDARLNAILKLIDAISPSHKD